MSRREVGKAIADYVDEWVAGETQDPGEQAEILNEVLRQLQESLSYAEHERDERSFDADARRSAPTEENYALKEAG